MKFYIEFLIDSARSEEETLQSKLIEIQKKTGNKFTLNEIKREYELTGKDEKKTLINLLKQKGFLSEDKKFIF